MITAIGIVMLVLQSILFWAAGACAEEYKTTRMRRDKHGEYGGLILGTIMLFAGAWLIAS